MTHHMTSHLARFIPVFFVVMVFTACGQTSAILPVDKSTSQFGGSSFVEATTLADPTPGLEQYRIFQQGATGYVSIQSVRDDIEQRAVQFCDRKGKSMNGLKETKSTPPYILGNFPRAELIFECAEKQSTASTSASAARAPTEDVKFNRLTNLKKLLDNGTLTQAEFDREKTKILSQP